MNWLLLIVGLAVLLGGGEALVRGATALARRLGVSPMVIGMTVLAFGTSAPELAVNVQAALTGNSAITFGNVVGSNIANVGLILGLTSLIQTLRIHRTIVTREIPIMLGATGLAIVLAGDWVWGSAPDRLGRIDGAILLLAFAVFLFITARNAIRARRDDQFIHEAEEEQEQAALPSVMIAVPLTVAGLVGVLLGSDWTVAGASGVAEALGMSEALIGLTIVAVGTSLPELTTSMFAALKGHADLAIGNIVGSNVFNLLFILGVSASIRAVPVPEDRGRIDLLVLAAFSLILLPFGITQKRLRRTEGALLLSGYAGFMVWRTFF
ncbi:MAG: calcium/sodium antiporter [Acidobacteria bacterium]|nr:calcium/sodium antiporter [Acidobacteriota bacterium]NIM63819.1 calcium/sodium antiporter [Acidobacteriota bacterium]NIO59753.1 calcium/sodium antiporter [Acidobacteriota bacterium]NIQ30836.1 calcium/sodium antiporter [Acidobacteriota bacterium]NIQ85909.1 calcium/sodium antiporter [Acidobacteriota bacterium]